MKKNLGIKAKMMIFSSVLAFVSASIGGAGFYALERVIGSYDEIANDNLPNIRDLSQMKGDLRRARVDIRTFAIPGLSEAQMKAAAQDLEETEKSYEKAAAAYTAIPLGPEEEKLYEEVTADWKQLEAIGAKAVKLAHSNLPADRAALEQLIRVDEWEIGVQSRAHINDLVHLNLRMAEEHTLHARSTASAGKIAIMSFLILGTLISFVVGALFSRQMSNILLSISRTLMTGSEDVAGASQSICSASEQLSSSTSQQAASLQETTAAVEEINAMVARNSEGAQQSKVSAGHCQGASEKGLRSANEVLTSIKGISQGNEEIAQQVAESNKQMAEVVRVINEIGSKTKVINDIVFQTKLLSFNASVEAARAGEQGKGFAVVAEEVGQLAASSGRAAQEISDMLDGSTKKVEQIVANTQARLDRLVSAGKARIAQGEDTAGECARALDEIANYVREMNGRADEIATASEEQARGIKEISAAMAQLDQATQENTSATAEAAASAGSLASQAEHLRTAAQMLMTYVQGGVAAPAEGTSVPASARSPSPSARLATRASVAPRAGVGVGAPAKKAAGVAATAKSDTPSWDDPGFRSAG